MRGNDSIDLSLEHLWRSWFAYRKGKKVSRNLSIFQYNLEAELFNLHLDLNSGAYKHGGYRKFIVCDNKRREISVASIRDRVVHRLVYDYLVGIYDKIFIYDVWSCREGKGLLGAISRAQSFFKSFSCYFVWRVDIRKFFDSVDHEKLLQILSLRIKDSHTFTLLEKIIRSFESTKGRNIGMPIGNLTSQIFSNIYLNELDRYMKHELKPLRYLRYGDDFIVIGKSVSELKILRSCATNFVVHTLCLEINPKHDEIRKIKHGLKFLGVVLYYNGRKLNKRNRIRIKSRLNSSNLSSYYGLIKQHSDRKNFNQFNWLLLGKSNLPDLYLIS